MPFIPHTEADVSAMLGAMVVVIIHDDTVDRTTDGRGRIGNLTLAEIKRLDAGANFGAAYQGERIPTLRELIDLVKASGNPRFRLNLEIKFAEGREGHPADLEERVLAVLRETGFLDRAITQSFHHASAAKMKRLAPTIPAGLLVGQRRQPADPAPGRWRDCSRFLPATIGAHLVIEV